MSERISSTRTSMVQKLVVGLFTIDANLLFFVDGKPIKTTFTQQHFRGGVRLDLEIVGRMEDNGAKIT